jgi:uracil-DNA glycosylase family 4
MSLDFLNSKLFSCRLCPRLVEWRERVAREKRRAYRDQAYWGRPVPGFGDPAARLLVVGLAPGAHGSNRTGRMFTGDASGDFLYPALYRAGFASQPDSTCADDGLTLRGLYITAVCRCAPPGNKPTPAEMQNCQPYLIREIELLRPKVFVALGRIAFDALLRVLDVPQPLAFAHGAVFRLEYARLKTASWKNTSPSPAIPKTALPNTDLLNTDCWLLASYHPSRQNTQTGRLTTEMFDSIWPQARQLLEE